MNTTPTIRTRLLNGLLLGVGLMLPTFAWSQSTTNVDVNSEGEGANRLSLRPAMSADGRYIAFESVATNLVTEDHNDRSDVFVHDRQTKLTTRVSVNTEGGDANGPSGSPSLSGDGRFVAFTSSATNLVEGDTSIRGGIFIYDRETATTSRLNVSTTGDEPNQRLSSPHLNTDGRLVAFSSRASNLVSNDENGVEDIFVHDRQTGTTTRVSVNTEGGDPDGRSFARFALSANGRFVTYSSAATNLVAGDTNGVNDIFVYDLLNKKTTRVSLNTEGGDPDGHSESPSLSEDGHYVAFRSAATNLVRGDNNGETDIFVFDRGSRTTERVSLNTPRGEGNIGSFQPYLSANGRFVVFISSATNLVKSDTNGLQDVFVRDRFTRITTRVNINNRGEQTEVSEFTQEPVISGNGRYVAFVSFATNLVGDGEDPVGTIFVRDRANPDRADVNGDENADVVWRNRITGATAVWLMNLTGLGASTPRETTFPGEVGLEWKIRGVRDVSGDGQADVVWHNTENGGTAVWLMNEGGLPETATFPGGAGLDWSIRGVGDVNSDGHADFVWRNTENGATAVWLMNEGGVLEAATFPGGAGLAWSIRGVADVNRDGTADWVWRNTSTGATAVWLMNKAGLREAATFPGGAGRDWTIEGVDDFDGDGHADLLWSNQVTGATALWFMNAAGTREDVLFPWASRVDETTQQVGDFSGDGIAEMLVRELDTDWIQIEYFVLDERVMVAYVSARQPDLPPEWEPRP